MKKRIAKKMSKLVRKYKHLHPEDFHDYYIYRNQPLIIRENRDMKLLCIAREIPRELFENVTEDYIKHLFAYAIADSPEFKDLLRFEKIYEDYHILKLGTRIYVSQY